MPQDLTDDWLTNNWFRRQAVVWTNVDQFIILYYDWPVIWGIFIIVTS